MVSADNRQMAKFLRQAMPETTFFLGSAEELTAYRNEVYPEHRGSEPVQHGQYDPINGVAFIANASGETILHEMLHAAIIAPLVDYFDDPAKLNQVQRDAVGNLQQLMEQFRGLDFSSEDPATHLAAQTLAEEIEHLQAKGDTFSQAAALSEFISWSLSNQNLIEVMRKTKVRSKLAKLVHEVLRGLRQLLGLAPEAKLDMFSNVAFNAGALLQAEALNEGGIVETAMPMGSVLNQVHGKPADERLSRLTRAFDQKITSHLLARDPKSRFTEELAVHDLANDAVNLFTHHGFDMDPQQQAAFRSMQAALASTMELSPKALVRVQRIFAHVTKTLDYSHLMADPDSQHPAEIARAQDQFNVLTGKFGTETDGEGRSNLMASFLALSQVSPELRTALDRIGLPKDREISARENGEFSMDQLLTTTAERSCSKNIGEPMAKRNDVGFLMTELGLSERRGCRLVGLARSVQHRPVPKNDAAVVARMKDLASEYRRYGCPRLHAMLRRVGLVANHKRTYRLYIEQGLQVRTTKRASSRDEIGSPFRRLTGRCRAGSWNS